MITEEKLKEWNQRFGRKRGGTEFYNTHVKLPKDVWHSFKHICDVKHGMNTNRVLKAFIYDVVERGRIDG